MTHAKVGAQASDYILPLGLIGILGVGAYFLFNKLIGPGGTNPGLGQGNTAASTAQQQGTTQTAADLAAQGVKQTIPAVTASSVANQIYALGQTGSNVDCMQLEQAIVNNVLNLADLNAIIAAFGTRSAVTGGGLDCSLLGLNCQTVDMPTYVRLVMTTSCSDVTGSALQSLNSYLSSQNINFQF